MKRSLERSTQEYQTQIPGSPGEQYLLARGITKESQASFRLGWTANPLPEERHLKYRISIPYLTRYGVVGIKYRSIGDIEPKYVSNDGFYAKRIFNPLSLTSRDRKIYICEGEIDCITLTQLGIPSVAVPGVNNWDSRAAILFRSRRVVIPADGDDNGQGLEFAKKLRSEIEGASYIVIPNGDVNSLYVNEGERALVEMIGYTDE